MVDKRLFPLLAALASSGLDWLVKDILAVLEEGELPVETDDAILVAQNKIKGVHDREFIDESNFITTLESWSGDEQVEIAGRIVKTRLEQSLGMAESSLNTIAMLVAGNSNVDLQQEVVQLVLLGGSGEPEGLVDYAAINRAVESLKDLQRAVDKWLSEALEREDLQ